MSVLDAAAIAQLAVRVGLIDEHTARECIYELDDRNAPAESLTRLMERKGLITPLQSSRLLKGETEGYFLGGYRILYKIASGSFGRVYRGDDPTTGQIVAIKVLRKKWTEDKRRVELFEREGRLGLTLQHPNIVQILAVRQDAATGQYYIVMDFVEGGNLRDILSIRQKLEYGEALRIIEECSAGLAYAHSRGLTHRDIKPTNILIGTDKVARLVDFGLAEISHAGTAVFYDKKHGKDKEDMEVDRTVDYAGLERLTGQKKGDPRSDIYFLGTVFFEMLTGYPILPPTRDRNLASMRQRYDLDEKVRSLGVEYGLPRNLIGLVAKMMAFDPAARFQTPAIMHEAVKQVRDELAGGIGSTSRQASGPLTILVVENHPKLQDVFRNRLKELGLRVLLTIDPDQAVKRYQQMPYHALLIDARTVGREGVEAFARVQREAELMHLDLAAALIVDEKQVGMANAAKSKAGGTIYVGSPTIKQLTRFLREQLQLADEEHTQQTAETE
jgi:serine/threonine protein kinase